MLGGIFFVANLLAGLSALAATRLASRFGLVNTMVFTHLPSNVLLILVPLMPNLPLAMMTLFLRFSISQMDVPTRQSYVMAVVPAEERSAAAGVTGVARTIGAAISPVFAGVLLASAVTIDLVFYIAGGLKIVYDLLLYRSFIKVRPRRSSGNDRGLHARKELRGGDPVCASGPKCGPHLGASSLPRASSLLCSSAVRGL